MTKNRIIYAVLAVVCVAFSVAYKSNFSAVLMIAVVMYLPIAAIFTAVSLFLADAVFLDSNYIGEKNTGFEFEIEVKNRFIMPFVPIELLTVIPDTEKGILEKRRIFVTLQPLGQTILSLKGMHKYRGLYKAEIKMLYAVDPLRIIRISRKVDRELTMVFLPRRFELEDLFRYSEGETAVSRNSAKNADKEDFSHVRDYREGDILQLVHWKLTAKSDSVMIKEYEGISDRKARIICDLNSCKKKSDILLNTDTVIETALAFAKTMLNENIVTSVDFGDVLRKNIIPVKCDTDYERLYELMSMLPSDAEVCDIDTMVGDVREEEQSVIVIITAELSEHTVFLANSASGYGTVIVAYINIENIPFERDYSKEQFRLMNISAPGKTALDKSVQDFGKGK